MSPRWVTLCILVLTSWCCTSVQAQTPTATLPDFVIAHTETELVLENWTGDSAQINGTWLPVEMDEDGRTTVTLTLPSEVEEVHVQGAGAEIRLPVNPIPLGWSVVPPLLAIVLAFLTREVFLSLFLGIFSGTAVLGWYGNGLAGVGGGFLRIFDTYVIEAMMDRGHLSIIVFSMTIGATVTLVSRNGGMQAVVNSLSRFANNARNGQLATYLLGLVIFFDDYANTLVVGNTMRSVTDRLRISREKLAYLVDSTAAPLAALAFVTTWIGAELGYIEDGISQIPEIEEGAYSIFLNSLAYSYYPILTLLFVFLIVWLQRDFGPMRSAEAKARQAESDTISAADEESSPELAEFKVKDGIQPRWWNAVIPIGVIILGTVIGLLVTGYDAATWNDATLGFFRKLSITIGNSDSYVALLWSSLCGLTIAIILSAGQRLLTLQESVSAALAGYKTMLTAMLILVLAWSLATLTEQLHTADFLRSLWSDTFPPQVLPAITFLLAALVSFSTGSSWGTMAILYPLLLPTSFSIAAEAGLPLEDVLPIFYNVTASILAGSVLGDHCSPISDTTILSSLASGCNHIQHVRTQLPYAATVGAIALFAGVLPAAYGVPAFILLPVGGALCYAAVRYLGKPVTES